MKKLNLGCGQKLMEGYVNVDNNPVSRPNVFHDLDKIPYPFLDNEFSTINMDHVLEHLADPIAVIQELYRIADNGAIIEIRSPHFSCGFLHPGHKSFISTALFDKFVGGVGDDYYGQCDFQVISIKLSWLMRPRARVFYLQVINKIINFFANIKPGLTQRVWCWYVGGFEEIYFKVKVVKSQVNH